MTRINTYDDMINYLFQISNRYNNALTGLKGSGLGIFTSRENKERIKQWKKDLKDCTEAYSKNDLLLQKLTTFDSDDILDFIAGYYSILYGTEYGIVTDVEFKEGKRTTENNIVASEDDLDIMENELTDVDSISRDGALGLINGPYLCLPSEAKYTLTEKGRFACEFKDHPELALAVKELVDLKLANSRIEQSVLFATALRNIATIKEEALASYEEMDEPVENPDAAFVERVIAYGRSLDNLRSPMEAVLNYGRGPQVELVDDIDDDLEEEEEVRTHTRRRGR